MPPAPPCAANLIARPRYLVPMVVLESPLVRSVSMLARQFARCTHVRRRQRAPGTYAPVQGASFEHGSTCVPLRLRRASSDGRAATASAAQGAQARRLVARDGEGRLRLVHTHIFSLLELASYGHTGSSQASCAIRNKEKVHAYVPPCTPVYTCTMVLEYSSSYMLLATRPSSSEGGESRIIILNSIASCSYYHMVQDA